MNDEIRKLKEALAASPDNQYLLQILLDTLVKNELWDELQNECLGLITQNPNDQNAKFGLARSYFGKENFGTSIIIIEELLANNPENIEALILLCHVQISENNTNGAVETFHRIKILKPGFSDSSIESKLIIDPVPDVERTEEPSFSDEVEDQIFGKKEKIKFKDVGGMKHEKEQIELKIIHPLQHTELYKSYGKKIGGGILFYGPPGCGKTYLAKATAGEIDSQFISVGIDEILDMYIGQSEKKLNMVFEKARAMSPCVLFFDEIDALGANRNDLRTSGGRNLINQFLAELDGMNSDNDGILIVGATNTPWHLDSAFRRPGRFDRLIFVQPPSVESRAEIFKLALAGKPLEDIDYSKLAKLTEGYSGADINACIDVAIEAKLQEAIKKGVPSPLRTKDLASSIKRVNPSTKEWFQTAKNYAMYANDSGVYDEILTYLKISK